MPAQRTIPASKLVALVAAILHGGGSNSREAEIVARRLVDADLVGDHARGVAQVSGYLSAIRAGSLRPNQAPTVVFESEAMAIINGNRGFSQVVGEFAADLGIAKAAQAGISMVGLRECGHFGRLAAWAEIAASAGQVSLHFANDSGVPRATLAEPSWTNRIAVGVPVSGAEPLILEAASSNIGEGELSGFAIACELLAGAVGAGRGSGDRDAAPANALLSIFISPALYDSDGGVMAEARRLIDRLKAARGAQAPSARIPGEIERGTREERLMNGVPLEQTAWQELLAAAASVGMDTSRVEQLGLDTTAP